MTHLAFVAGTPPGRIATGVSSSSLSARRVVLTFALAFGFFLAGLPSSLAAGVGTPVGRIGSVRGTWPKAPVPRITPQRQRIGMRPNIIGGNLVITFPGSQPSCAGSHHFA